MEGQIQPSPGQTCKNGIQNVHQLQENLPQRALPGSQKGLSLQQLPTASPPAPNCMPKKANPGNKPCRESSYSLVRAALQAEDHKREQDARENTVRLQRLWDVNFLSTIP